jgi:hypothetical protein
MIKSLKKEEFVIQNLKIIRSYQKINSRSMGVNLLPFILIIPAEENAK